MRKLKSSYQRMTEIYQAMGFKDEVSLLQETINPRNGRINQSPIPGARFLRRPDDSRIVGITLKDGISFIPSFNKERWL